MIRRFQLFLGPARLRALFVLLASTGIISLILNALSPETNLWVRPVQSLLVVAFLMGAAFIVGGRMNSDERKRWLAVLAPAVAGFLLGLFFLPQLRAPFIGAGIGWIAAALFLTRSKIPMQYRDAVRHLRKNEYAEAVKVMDGVVKAEPDQPNHYRFRAEILRLWGKLDRARRDYQKMIEIDPDSAIAYNGLAEVMLQAEDFAAARDAAIKAYQLAPNDWVTSYNLGMIEDRLRQSERVIEHLKVALALKVPDVRHRLLIHLYLARAYQRLGNADAAQIEIKTLEQQRDGLDEWQTIMASDQAETLRAVLAADIQTAQKLVNGEFDIAAWSSG